MEGVFMATNEIAYNKNDFNSKFFSEGKAKYCLARLQSIITEKNRSAEANESRSTLTNLQASKGFDLASNVLNAIPDETINNFHSITLKVFNNTEGIFYPYRVAGPSRADTSRNFDLCPPYESTSVKFIVRNDHWDSSSKQIETEFYQIINGYYYLLKIKFQAENSKWQMQSFSSYLIPRYSNPITLYENASISAVSSYETYMFAMEHKTDDSASYCISSFAVSSYTDDANIVLVIMPWYRNADHF